LPQSYGAFVEDVDAFVDNHEADLHWGPRKDSGYSIGLSQLLLKVDSIPARRCQVATTMPFGRSLPLLLHRRPIARTAARA
jgi:hypothetical protein